MRRFCFLDRTIEGSLAFRGCVPEPVICAYARTPIGKYRGSLSGYSGTELGAMAVEELLKRARIDPASGVIDQLYMGPVSYTHLTLPTQA